MKSKKSSEQLSSLVTDTSLQGYFLDQLTEVNQKSTVKLPQEALIYSSMVMDRFGESGQYFEVIEGKPQEKVLGTKLLSIDNMNKEAKKRALRDIGDTSLCLCGFFSDSLNRKIVDSRYYRELGVIAYQRLNSIVPDYYDIPSFFKIISESLNSIIMMMNLVAQRHFSSELELQPAMIVSDYSKIKAS